MQSEWQQWRDAVGHAEIDNAIGDLYVRIDTDIAARGPTCWSSGKCCRRFDSYGHRLYVTGLEIARFTKHSGPVAPREPSAASRLPILNAARRDACVFQIDGLCSTHTTRPLGCRVYFCQQGTQDWQRELYERYQADLRAMHERWALPYRYMEWRAGLEACESSVRSKR